jgi:hypothetical protein
MTVQWMSKGVLAVDEGKVSWREDNWGEKNTPVRVEFVDPPKVLTVFLPPRHHAEHN